MTSRTIFGLPLLNSLCVGFLTIAVLLNAGALILGGPARHVLPLVGFVMIIPQLGLGALTTADRMAGRKAPGWALPLSIVGQILVIVCVVLQFTDRAG